MTKKRMSPQCILTCDDLQEMDRLQDIPKPQSYRP